MKKIGRNVPCPCGSTLKYKNCCLDNGTRAGVEREIRTALELMQSGQYLLAEENCRRLLAREAGNPDVIHLAGMVQQKLKRYDRAEELLNASLRLAPHEPVYHVNLGNLQRELNRFDAALSCYRRALELDPSGRDPLNNYGITLRDLGRLDEAETLFRELIAGDPGYAVAHFNLGDILRRLGRNDEALASCRRALELDPQLAATLLVAGNDRLNEGLTDEALACFRDMAEIRPDFYEAHLNAGVAMFDQGRFDEAIESYRRAIDCYPCHALAHRNLGTALYSLGRLDEALAAYRRAIELEPDYVEALDNLGSVLLARGRFPEAMASYERALSFNPDYLTACSNLLMASQYDVSLTNEQVYRRSAELGRRFEEPASLRRRPALHAPERGEKVRVGLVSGDLRNHPVGLFLESALRHMDGNLFSFTAYANQSRFDDLSERIRPLFTQWVNVRGMSYRDLAQRVREDRIQILVDLAGHTAFNSLPAFGLGPAPVQVSWIGFANTTGMGSMDYIIADPITVPPGEERFYAEKVWRLPESYLCFTPPLQGPEVSGLPALENRHVTFGCFSNAAKLNDSVLACWARILLAVPDARLLLKFRAFSHQPDRDEMIDRFRLHGIDASRLLFEGYSERSDYLAAYRKIDFVLDPFPFPGATTTCEAAWMGVPTLTMRSARGMVGRNGELIMTRLGLEEWVAGTVDEYVAKGIRFSRDAAALASLRPTLRERLLASPLCDSERFAKHLGEAFLGMLAEKRGGC